MNQKKRVTFGALLMGVLLPLNVMAESMTVDFPESMNQSQSRLVSLPDKAHVTGVSVNTGEVTYSKSGSELLLSLRNGTPSSSKYNPSKYSKFISKTMTSGVNSFPSSDSYSDGTYTGTYYKDGSSYVYSGTYTPPDSRTQYDSRSTSPGGSSGSLPSSIWYSSGGYSGTLYGGSPYVSSGSYTPSDSRSQSEGRSYRCGNSYVWSSTSRSWSYGGTYSIDSIASSISYNSGGYSGTLYQGGVLSACSAPAPSLPGSYNGERRNSNAGYTTINYSGTVTRPASADTRVWTVNYSGSVSRPASDTRIWAQNYSGYAYAGGYDTYYKYSATIDYELDDLSPDGDLSASPTTLTNENVTITLSNIKDFGASGVKGVYLPNGNFMMGSTLSYSVSTNGTYDFIIEDNVGNRTTKSIYVGNIDKSVPTATISQTPTSYTNQDVMLTLSDVSDSGVSGLKHIVMPDGKVVTDFDGISYIVPQNGTYSFEIWDNAGNQTVKSITVSNIDKLSPTADLNASTNTATNENVLLTLSNIRDTGVSGLKGITLPDGNIVTGATATYTVTENGVYTFLVEDKAGNRWTKTVNVTNIDKTKPIGQVKQDTTSWTNQSYGLELTGLSDSESGIKRVQLPDGEWRVFSATDKYRYLVNQNGVYTYRIEDEAGNMLELNQSVGNIDKTIPEGTFTYDISRPNEGLLIELNATDDLSGVQEITLPDGKVVSASNAQYRVKNGGEYAFITRDRAGNKHTIVATIKEPKLVVERDGLELVVTVEKNYTVLPTTTRKETLETWNSTSFRVPLTKNETFTFQVNDGGVLSKEVVFSMENFFLLGMPQIDISYDENWTNKEVVLRAYAYSLYGHEIVSTTAPDGTASASTTLEYTVNKNGTYTFIAKDSTGQLGANSIIVRNIDTESPTIELLTPAEWTNQDVPININILNN